MTQVLHPAAQAQGTGAGDRGQAGADWGPGTGDGYAGQAIRASDRRQVDSTAATVGSWLSMTAQKGWFVGSVIKKRRKRMAKKKHRKLLKKTRVQRRRLGK